MALRFAFLLAMVLIAGFVSGVPAGRDGLPGDPPQPQLPPPPLPAAIPPPAGEGRAYPLRCRFYHDRDVRVIGTALIFLAGACYLLRSRVDFTPR